MKEFCGIRLHFLCIITFVIAYLSFIPYTFAANFHVSSASGLQDALWRAENNGEDDNIKIQQGTYTGNFVYASAEKNDLTIEGGYNVGFTSQTLNPGNTVLDGDGFDHVMALNCQGMADFTVSGLTFQNGSAKTVEDGGGLYLKTNGYVNLSYNSFCENFAPCRGGGAYISGRGNTLINNTFANNSAQGSDYIYGGGAYLSGSCKLVKNTFTENSAKSSLLSAEGGGAFIWGGANILKGNTFTENSAMGYQLHGLGGGAKIRGSYNELQTTKFIKNTAGASHGSGYGGGLYLYYHSSNNTLDHNIFTGNVVTSGNSYESCGGGLYGGGLLTNNTFTENSVSEGEKGLGAGAYVCEAALINNVLIGNFTADVETGAGGGVYLEDGTLTNNTLSGNYANSQGGGLFGLFNSTEVSAEIYNNIIWGNSAPEGADLYIDNRRSDDPFFSVPVNLFNNDLDQSALGTGIAIPFTIATSNLNNLNPQFVGEGDYRLMSTSPCVDTGNNAAPYLPEKDKNGASRILESTVDMGAYESDGTATAPPKPPILTVTTSLTTATFVWTSVSNAQGYNFLYAPSPYTGPESISVIHMGSQTSFSAVLWEGVSYLVAVQGYNEYGSSGYSNIELFEIGKSSDPPPNPKNLCICETGSRTELNALNGTLCWSPSTNPTISDYEILILDTATGERRRLVEHIRGCSWSYGYGTNKGDSTGCADENSDGANDHLTIRLWAVNAYNQRSEGYDEISITNPRPSNVAGLTSAAWMNGVQFLWDQNPEPDIEAYQYQWRIVTAPTTPWTEILETTGLGVFIFLDEDQRPSYPDGATIEIRIWAMDTWGNTSASAVVDTGVTDTFNIEPK